MRVRLERKRLPILEKMLPLNLELSKLESMSVSTTACRARQCVYVSVCTQNSAVLRRDAGKKISDT